jgi:hypothetical protein
MDDGGDFRLLLPYLKYDAAYDNLIAEPSSNKIKYFDFTRKLPCESLIVFLYFHRFVLLS